MSTKESLLLEKTFNDADGTMRRVYYTLTQGCTRNSRPFMSLSLIS